ncbi:serine/threonine protein kinase [Archangium gephyra]|uniref:Serine/threonine protein kinase n=1 Tax=Archangium gephyra TaxID=48 RepID=A0AAC8QCK4_9BACT|nr:serine/threonine-protein kinase [Archangium gephyra]AKJ04914.1 serine/threonine protein kinase [Archangium gephyra]REG37046.1 serine/threonine protein kinase [Archangium gephyra]
MANPGDPGNAGLDFDRGRRIGKYEIVTRLSVGGMAELFLAFTAGPGGFRKFVALKQILPDIQKDEHFVRMFLDEARITAALAHANIAQVFDLGQEDDELYLAMEFLAGQNLEQILQASLKQQRPLPLGFSARAVRDACLGLHYAHHFTDPSGKPRPVVHRDVSPKNVMVTFEGHVKVIDFGIAKAKGRLGRTQVGMVKGTTGYMSPEQVQGSEQLDGRSDLFCAGIILHELLCGRRLFSGSHEGAVMLKIAAAEVPSPSSLNPRVPEALSQVVMRALAREPERRFASGREMARAIEAACGQELFHEEQLAAVMRQLFEDKLQKTRALLESANGLERDTGVEKPAVPLGAPDKEEPTERVRRVAPPVPAAAPRVAKSPSGQVAPLAAPPAKTPAPVSRRASPVAAPARTPPARGAFSRPVAAEPEEDEEDPLDKTQPVRRAPGGFRPTAIPDEDETTGTEEREVTLPSARAQLSPAAQAELAKQRRSWGGWLFLLLLLVAVGVAFYHPPTRALLTPLFATALERLKGEELPHGPPPAEPLAVPPPSPSTAQAAGEGTQAPEPTQPAAEQEPVEAQAPVVAQAAEPTPEPTRAASKRTRKPATPAPADTEPESRPKAAAPAKPATAEAEPPVDGEPEVIDTSTAKGAAKAELGWLTLRTIPRAAVFDGENQLGTTPLRKVPLPVDTYRLLVVDPDGVNKMLSVPIKPGQVTDMTVRISDLPDWAAP